MSTLQEDLAVAKKLKKEVAVKLKGDGNQIQFSFNSDIISDLTKIQKRISADDSASLNLVSGIILKLNRRNKLKLGLRINLPSVGKLCVSMKVMILRQIHRME